MHEFLLGVLGGLCCLSPMLYALVGLAVIFLGLKEADKSTEEDDTWKRPMWH